LLKKFIWVIEMKEREIKEFKAMVGKFMEEMKSNSVTDLVVWLDCKTNYEEFLREQHKKMRRHND
jgi:hypothetical protein